jgi:hypothetical protein
VFEVIKNTTTTTTTTTTIVLLVVVVVVVVVVVKLRKDEHTFVISRGKRVKGWEHKSKMVNNFDLNEEGFYERILDLINYSLRFPNTRQPQELRTINSADHFAELDAHIIELSERGRYVDVIYFYKQIYPSMVQAINWEIYRIFKRALHRYNKYERAIYSLRRHQSLTAGQ